MHGISKKIAFIYRNSPPSYGTVDGNPEARSISALSQSGKIRKYAMNGSWSGRAYFCLKYKCNWSGPLLEVVVSVENFLIGWKQVVVISLSTSRTYNWCTAWWSAIERRMVISWSEVISDWAYMLSRLQFGSTPDLLTLNIRSIRSDRKEWIQPSRSTANLRSTYAHYAQYQTKLCCRYCIPDVPQINPHLHLARSVRDFFFQNGAWPSCTNTAFQLYYSTTIIS